MLKWMCAVAASLALAGPAFAQKTDLPDRPAKQTTEFDVTSIREGNALLKANGACTAQYIVGANGRAKDITVDCTHAGDGALRRARHRDGRVGRRNSGEGVPRLPADAPDLQLRHRRRRA